MKNLMKKSKKGFTLMEMLIVVAIIAILVVIAIPTFTNALNEAKSNTDLANARAWYAEMVMEGMLDEGTLPSKVEAKTYAAGKAPWGDLQYDKGVVTVSGSSLDDFEVAYDGYEGNNGSFGGND